MESADSDRVGEELSSSSVGRWEFSKIIGVFDRKIVQQNGGLSILTFHFGEPKWGAEETLRILRT